MVTTGDALPGLSIWFIWSVTLERIVCWRNIKSLWNLFDEGCLLMPSLDYLMADRGIHAGTRRERDRENNGLFHSRDNSVIPIF